jgi:hypothetical protein
MKTPARESNHALDLFPSEADAMPVPPRAMPAINFSAFPTEPRSATNSAMRVANVLIPLGLILVALFARYGMFR